MARILIDVPRHSTNIWLLLDHSGMSDLCILPSISKNSQFDLWLASFCSQFDLWSAIRSQNHKIANSRLFAMIWLVLHKGEGYCSVWLIITATLDWNVWIGPCQGRNRGNSKSINIPLEALVQFVFGLGFWVCRRMFVERHWITNIERRCVVAVVP